MKKIILGVIPMLVFLFSTMALMFFTAVKAYQADHPGKPFSMKMHGGELEVDGEVITDGFLNFHGNGIAVLGAALFSIVIFLMLHQLLSKDSWARLLGLLRPNWNYLAIALVSTAFLITTVYILEKIPVFQTDAVIPFPGWTLRGLLLLLGIGFFAPILEELVFRYAIMDGLQSLSGYKWVAIIGSAIPFALGHMQYNWAIIVSLVFVGIVLGSLRYQYNSLFIPIVIHCLYNSIGLAFFT